MKYGFVKVGAATPEIKVADTKYNAEQIIKIVNSAKKQGVQLLVFPELCITGATCGDLFNYGVLIDGAKNALKDIVIATKSCNMLIFVGVPYVVNGALYNCAAAICNGELLGLIPKSYLAEYGDDCECRNFISFDGIMRTVEWDDYFVPFGTRLIFKDKSNANFTVTAEIGSDLFSAYTPSIEHVLAGANIVVNLCAEKENVDKAEKRRIAIKSHTEKLSCGYVMASAGEGESTTDFVFAGHNIIAETGEIIAENALFENSITISEIDTDKIAFEKKIVNLCVDTQISADYDEIVFDGFCEEGNLTRKISAFPFIPKNQEDAEKILSMQAMALKKRIIHTNAKKAVIGVSGGLDSALALLVTVRAFNAMNKDLSDIIAITMPCFGTSDKTYNNSLKLMNNLGVTFKTVSIKNSVVQHFKDISHDENVKNATYENAQARMRTMVLMNIANEENGLVIGTGDLSELALGWATFNGDHMSMYGVNASVSKTLVKYLVAFEAKRYSGDIGEVLNDIVGTEISPELLPPDKEGKIAQKTEEVVGPYELHDFYLYHAIRYGQSPEKILYMAKYAFSDKYDYETLKKWLVNFYKRFFSQQFKRSCMPDGVKIGEVSLSPRGSWRMPSDAVARLWLEKIQ